MRRATVELKAAAASDPGRVRTANQDAYLALPEEGIFVVADGMGGQQAGEVAAQAVVSLLPRMVGERARSTTSLRSRLAELILRQSISDLSEKLRLQSSGKPGLQGMGTTVAALWIPRTTGAAHLAHIGDSRIYLWRDGQLRRSTEDHSLLALLVKLGEVKPEEAEGHPARSQLSRYVGMQGEAVPDVQTLPVQDGDRLLLCSDGLTGMISDEQIATLLTEVPDRDSTCRALVGAANAAGGKDNITVILVDIGFVGVAHSDTVT